MKKANCSCSDINVFKYETTPLADCFRKDVSVCAIIQNELQRKHQDLTEDYRNECYPGNDRAFYLCTPRGLHHRFSISSLMH